MNLKSITSISLFMVQVCLPSNQARTLHDFHPTADAYEAIVRNACTKDGQTLSNPDLAPVKSFLAKALLKNGRLGVSALLNNNPDYAPLKESMQALRNREVFRLELFQGANPSATVGGKSKKTYVDLAKELDGKPENAGKDFAKAIEDANKYQQLELILCDAKYGVDMHDVARQMRSAIDNGTIQEEDVLRFINEEISDLNAQARALDLVKRCFKGGPYVDEHDGSRKETSDTAKIILVGAVCASVGGLLGAAILASTK